MDFGGIDGLVKKRKEVVFSPIVDEIDWEVAERRGGKAAEALAAQGVESNTCVFEAYSVLDQLKMLSEQGRVDFDRVKTFAAGKKKTRGGQKIYDHAWVVIEGDGGVEIVDKEENRDKYF